MNERVAAAIRDLVMANRILGNEGVPFTVTNTPIEPIRVMASGSGSGVPNWDIRDEFPNEGTMLVVNNATGESLAKKLGGGRVCRLRGRLLVALLLAAVCLGRPAALHAESFPAGPVKIVVPVGAGAAPDLLTRLITERLQTLWGQPVVIENKPGGAGAVAIKAVAPAAPDGHTLYMALASNFIALPELQTNFPLDVLQDLVPIGFVGEQPIMIAAPPSLGVNTFPELIALLKSKPGELNIAGGNRGSILHLTGEWLRSATGAKFTLVHYNGGAAAIPDVIGGRVQVTIDAIASMRAPLDSGQVRPLAETAKHGLDNFPNVPAAAETLPGFEAMGWMALMGPRGTPPAIAEKISADLRTVLAIPELKTRLVEFGNYVRPLTSAETKAYIVEQQQIWRPVIVETAKAIR